MKRWEYVPGNGGDCTSMMEQREWGDYVLYAEAQERIDALEGEITRRECLRILNLDRIETLEWLVEVYEMELWIYADAHYHLRDCAVFENGKICRAARLAAGVN